MIVDNFLRSTTHKLLPFILSLILVVNQSLSAYTPHRPRYLVRECILGYIEYVSK